MEEDEIINNLLRGSSIEHPVDNIETEEGDGEPNLTKQVNISGVQDKEYLWCCPCHFSVLIELPILILPCLYSLCYEGHTDTLHEST